MIKNTLNFLCCRGFRRLLTLAASLAFSCVLAHGAANVTFNLADFTSGPITNKTVRVIPVVQPSVSGTNIITGDRRQFTTPRTSGTYTLTNVLAGSYRCELDGPFQMTTWFITVATNATGTVSASSITSASTNITTGIYAWSTTASDARYARAGTAGNSFVAGAGLLGVTNDGVITASIDPLSTNQFATTNYVASAIQVATNGLNAVDTNSIQKYAGAAATNYTDGVSNSLRQSIVSTNAALKEYIAQQVAPLVGTTYVQNAVQGATNAAKGYTDGVAAGKLDITNGTSYGQTANALNLSGMSQHDEEGWQFLVWNGDNSDVAYSSYGPPSFANLSTVDATNAANISIISNSYVKGFGGLSTNLTNFGTLTLTTNMSPADPVVWRFNPVPDGVGGLDLKLVNDDLFNPVSPLIFKDDGAIYLPLLTPSKLLRLDAAGAIASSTYDENDLATNINARMPNSLTNSLWQSATNASWIAASNFVVAATNAIVDADAAFEPSQFATNSSKIVLKSGIVLTNMTNFGPFNIASQAAPGSPIDGDIWNDSTGKYLAGYTAGATMSFQRILFTGTSHPLVTNTTGEVTLFPTGVGRTNYPANFFTAGRVVSIRGRFLTTGASQNFVIKIKIGAVTVTSVALGGGTIANATSQIDCTITCDSAGASGTINVNAFVGSGSWTYVMGNATRPATMNGAFDTTAAGGFDITVTPNNAGQSWCTQSMIIEVLN